MASDVPKLGTHFYLSLSQYIFFNLRHIQNFYYDTHKTTATFILEAWFSIFLFHTYLFRTNPEIFHRHWIINNNSQRSKTERISLIYKNKYNYYGTNFTSFTNIFLNHNGILSTVNIKDILYYEKSTQNTFKCNFCVTDILFHLYSNSNTSSARANSVNINNYCRYIRM